MSTVTELAPEMKGLKLESYTNLRFDGESICRWESDRFVVTGTYFDKKAACKLIYCMLSYLGTREAFNVGSIGQGEISVVLDLIEFVIRDA